LNLSDFLLWGLLKEMFPRKPSNETEMRVKFVELCRRSEKDMFYRRRTGDKNSYSDDYKF